MRLRNLFTLLILILGGVSYLEAQIADPRFNVYYVNTDEFPTVKMHYTLNRRGGLKVDPENVEVSDFTVIENGTDKTPTLEQKCGEIEYDIPISATIVLDITLSMEEITRFGEVRFEWVKDAAQRFNDSLKFETGSKARVVSFAGSGVGKTNWIYSHDSVEAEIEELITAPGQTNYNEPFELGDIWEEFDAIGNDSRKVIVFLTDGNHSSAEEFKWEEFRDEALSRDVTVYTIAVDVESPSSNLGFLANETGGEALTTDLKDKLFEFYDEIFLDIGSRKDQCWLEYTADLSCEGADAARNVEATYLGFDPRILSSSFTYEAPGDKLISLKSDKNLIYFSDNAGGSLMNEVDLTASNGDFEVLNISVTPDDGNFTVNRTNFNVASGAMESFEITYVPDGNPSKEYQLNIETDLCPVDPITLIAPCGADAPSNVSFNSAKETPAFQTLVITNTTQGELIGQATIVGADNDKFTITSGDEPFTLDIGGTHEIQVQFLSAEVGNFTANVDWQINTECGTQLTELDATVLDLNVVLTPQNFTETRVETTSAPLEVSVRNVGDSPVTITGFSWQNTPENNFSDLPSITSEEIAPSGDYSFNITFTPQNEGPISNNILVSIEGIADPISAQISGIGTLPQIDANNIDFPDTDISTPATPIAFTIVNNSNTEDLLITEIKFEDGTNAGDFSFEAGSQLTNVTVNQNGANHSVNIEFTPINAGNRTARIEVIANTLRGDANATESHFYEVSGLGLGADSYTINLTDLDFGTINSCATRTLQSTVINPLNEEITVTASITNDDDGVFAVVGTNPVIIAANSQGTIEVEFTPNDNTSFTANLEITTDDNLGFGTSMLSGSGESEQVQVNVSTSNNGSVLQPGEEFTLNYDFTLPTLNSANYNDLEIVLEYNAKQLVYDENFSHGSNLPWNMVQPVKVDLNNDRVIYTFNLTGADLQATNFSGSFKFSSLLYQVDDNAITVSVDNSNTCVTSGVAETNIRVNSCINELQAIVEGDFNIGSISPNPVSTDSKLTIKIPSDGDASILIFDQRGNVAYTIHNSYLNAGTYEITIPASELSSGAYFLNIKASGRNKTQSFIISK